MCAFFFILMKPSRELLFGIYRHVPKTRNTSDKTARRGVAGRILSSGWMDEEMPLYSLNVKPLDVFAFILQVASNGPVHEARVLRGPSLLKKKKRLPKGYQRVEQPTFTPSILRGRKGLAYHLIERDRY